MSTIQAGWEEQMDRGAGAFEIRRLRLAEIRSLYNQRLTRDFPADELKPLSVIELALLRGRYICYGAVAGEAILAYVYLVKLDQWALVDYYAVAEELRNTGIGSRFLKALMAGPLREMKCVLLEIEDPESARDPGERETRNRRLAFYLRNGLRETGIAAVVWHVHFRILELPLGEPMEADGIRQIYGAIYRSMLPKRVFDRMVKIG